MTWYWEVIRHCCIVWYLSIIRIWWSDGHQLFWTLKHSVLVRNNWPNKYNDHDVAQWRLWTKNPAPRMDSMSNTIINYYTPPVCTMIRLKFYEILAKSTMKSTKNTQDFKSVHKLLKLVNPICGCMYILICHIILMQLFVLTALVTIWKPNNE